MLEASSVRQTKTHFQQLKSFYLGGHEDLGFAVASFDIITSMLLRAIGLIIVRIFVFFFFAYFYFSVITGKMSFVYSVTRVDFG